MYGWPGLNELRAAMSTASQQTWLLAATGPSLDLWDDTLAGHYPVMAMHILAHKLPFRIAFFLDFEWWHNARMIRGPFWAKAPSNPIAVVPWMPLHYGGTGHTLARFSEKYPTLLEWRDAGRLFAYNCTTQLAEFDPPVIRCWHSSAEPAIDILGYLGVKRILTIGVDGGTQHSQRAYDPGIFDNPRAIYSKQWKHIARLQSAYGFSLERITPDNIGAARCGKL